MKYQKTFKRFEMKYLLTKEEKEEVLSVLKTKMKLDKYGRTTIRNIYFDTDTYRLIRRSIEKPVYKEKLRLRSYQSVKPEDEVFIELKKKYKSVVYKRRLSLPERQTMDAFLKNTPLPVESQIVKEIEYFREFYQDLKPKVFLSYEREAYYALDGSDFRVTFDENIRYACLSMDDKWIYLFMESKTSKLYLNYIHSGDYRPIQVDCDTHYTKAIVCNGNAFRRF